MPDSLQFTRCLENTSGEKRKKRGRREREEGREKGSSNWLPSIMLMRLSLGVKEKKSGCQKILPERERERERHTDTKKNLSFLVRH